MLRNKKLSSKRIYMLNININRLGNIFLKSQINIYENLKNNTFMLGSRYSMFHYLNNI